MAKKFPPTPEKDRFADDLGYWTKVPEKKPIKSKVKPKYLLGNT